MAVVEIQNNIIYKILKISEKENTWVKPDFFDNIGAYSRYSVL